MESNIKGLVAAGHEMASELKAECGAVDDDLAKLNRIWLKDYGCGY